MREHIDPAKTFVRRQSHAALFDIYIDNKHRAVVVTEAEGWELIALHFYRQAIKLPVSREDTAQALIAYREITDLTKAIASCEGATQLTLRVAQSGKGPEEIIVLNHAIGAFLTTLHTERNTLRSWLVSNGFVE